MVARAGSWSRHVVFERAPTGASLSRRLDHTTFVEADSNRAEYVASGTFPATLERRSQYSEGKTKVLLMRRLLSFTASVMIQIRSPFFVVYANRMRLRLSRPRLLSWLS
jgi:hypothetical protein